MVLYGRKGMEVSVFCSPFFSHCSLSAVKKGRSRLWHEPEESLAIRKNKTLIKVDCLKQVISVEVQVHGVSLKERKHPWKLNKLHQFLTCPKKSHNFTVEEILWHQMNGHSLPQCLASVRGLLSSSWSSSSLSDPLVTIKVWQMHTWWRWGELFPVCRTHFLIYLIVLHSLGCTLKSFGELCKFPMPRSLFIPVKADSLCRARYIYFLYLLRWFEYIVGMRIDKLEHFQSSWSP